VLLTVGLSAGATALSSDARAQAAPEEGEKPADAPATPPAEAPAPPADEPPAPEPPKPTLPPEGPAPRAQAPAAGTDAGVAVSATATPGADVPEPSSEPLAPQVPWRGTQFEWINSATTTMLGVGRDNISDSHEAYSMTFRLTLNYFVIDQDLWTMALWTRPTLYTELTNSDSTTTEREPEFLDLPLLAKFAFNAYNKDGWSTKPALDGGLIFPTWKVTYNSGTILSTTNRAHLTQTIPLLGDDIPVLSSATVVGLFRWDHRFSKADSAVRDDLDRPRQGSRVGFGRLDDQLSGSPLARDTLIETLTLGLSQAPGGVPVDLSFDFFFTQQFKTEFAGTGCDVELATGCVDAASQENVEHVQKYYGFGTTLGVTPVPELGIELSYSSTGSPLGQHTLAEDGTRRSIFYAPDAEFGLNLILHPDAFYQRFASKPAASTTAKKKTKSKAAKRKTEPREAEKATPAPAKKSAKKKSKRKAT
jgi:hypothetical protein